MAFRLDPTESPVFGYGASESGRAAFEAQIDDQPWSAALGPETLEFGGGDLDLGVHDLAPGRHLLSLRALPGCGPVGVEAVRCLALPPPAKRDRKTDNEAHFFRLGIGRAVYAYRLAFGALPPNLEDLVEKGILDPRYTCDENGGPVSGRVEGDVFVARAADWVHSWKGLDARR
jgi:hypothetical protein